MFTTAPGLPFLSDARVSWLQMCTTAPGLPFLHVTCRSLGLQMFTTAPHLPCLHLTCRSVGLQMWTTAPGLPCLPLTCRIVGITVLHHCTYPYLSLSHLQECQHYRFAPLYLAFSVTLSSARVSWLQMCTTAPGLLCLPLTCRSVRITDVHLYTWPSFFPSHLHEWTPLVNENRAPNIFSV